MAQCEPLNQCQVSLVTFGVSKNVKFQLSRNLTKFDVLAGFRETIPTVKFVSSSDILKKFEFSTKITVLPFIIKLDFIGFYKFNPIFIYLFIYYFKVELKIV